VIFPNAPECDESEYIQAVQAGGGTEAHFVNAKELGPLSHMESMLRHQDQPFFAPNLFLHWALYDAAREQQVRVLLDGIDGDTTVSHGIAILQELARGGRWIALTREIFGLSRRFKRPALGLLKNQVLRPFLPETVRRGLRLFRRKQRGANSILLLNRTFASRLERTQMPHENDAVCPHSVRHDHHRSLTHGLVPYVLEVADHAAMTFSIEPRYPFFDRRLAEYCLALPAEQKIFHGWTRMVMRRGMTNILPEKVQWRGGKSDLSPNFFRSLITSESSVLEELKGKVAAPVWEYVAFRTFENLYSRAISLHDRDAALALWKVVTLDFWLRSFNSPPRIKDHREGSDDSTNAVQTGLSAFLTTQN